MPRPPIPEHLAARLADFRRAIFKRKLDAVLVSDRMDGYYLTGFTGEDGLILVTPTEVVLLTDGRFDEQADRQAPWATKRLRQGRMSPLLVKELKRRRLHTVGCFPGSLTALELSEFRKALRSKELLKGAKAMRLTPAPGVLAAQRQRKDAHELAVLRQAVAAAQAAFAETRPLIRPGVTELDVAAELIYRMQKHGASGPSFEPIVASGPNAALAHYRAGPVPVDFRSGLLIDWGARLGEYCSDLTRVLLPARVDRDWQRIYDVCLEAQEAAIAAIRPGEKLRRVDAVARKVLRRHRLERYFTHGLGHGIGLAIHEPPRLNRFVDPEAELQPGMVVTVEPGLYLKGRAGVRIEDDVLVTPTGHEVLTSVPKLREAMRLG